MNPIQFCAGIDQAALQLSLRQGSGSGQWPATAGTAGVLFQSRPTRRVRPHVFGLSGRGTAPFFRDGFAPVAMDVFIVKWPNDLCRRRHFSPVRPGNPLPPAGAFAPAAGHATPEALPDCARAAKRPSRSTASNHGTFSPRVPARRLPAARFSNPLPSGADGLRHGSLPRPNCHAPPRRAGFL
jgi:hypothetical protein